ncbi:MAG: cadherin-like domain-containing protein [Rhizobiales bacterium]|nr:cadherin-like domain-containing protein [Hyphomicrobiales bacterium]
MRTSDFSLGRSEFSTIGSDGTVTIADSELLISGTYSRDGDDLVLTGDDGQQLHVIEYFSQSTPPALISSDGKMLSGDTVSLLAGPQAPGQYAQSTGGQFGDAIGQVETLQGSASAQRPNGLNVELEVGSLVYQGDVVSASANSTVGITFLDKTVFTIAEGGTMVLNEMVYDPSGSSNSMLFNLLGGTAAFVAGAVAKTGDMKIETPVAVMAIRGTEPFASCQSGASCYFGGASGKYDLLHKVLGQVLATVDDPSQVVALDSINGTPSISGANALQQATMGQMFRSLRDAIRVLEERLDDGEDPVREAGTGSPDFTDGNFLEDIGGFFFSSMKFLLGGTSLALAPQAQPEDVPLEPPDPILHASTNEDSSFIIAVITEDDLLELGPLAIVIGANVTSGLGTASPTADGLSVVYDPGVAYNSLSVGDSASVRIAIEIDLGNGTTQTETAFVTVVGLNDAPTANPDIAATNEGTLISIDVLNNDTDPDANDELTVAQATIISGLGTVAVAADGQAIIYDPNGAYDFLSAGETEDVVISYRLSDGQGGVSTATATVTVSGLNEAPNVGAGDVNGRVTELPDGSIGENVSILTTAGVFSFSDVDGGDGHTLSIDEGGDGYLGALTASVTNVAADDGRGQITWSFSISDADIDAMAAGERLVQAYTITIDDGNGGTITQVVTVRIFGTNDAPVITSGAGSGDVTELADDAALLGSAILTATGNLNFEDVDLSDGHTVSVTENSGGFRGTLTAIVSDPSQGDGSGSISWTFNVDDADLEDLAAGEFLTQTYTITVIDPNGATDTQQVTITLNGANDAPEIESGTDTGAVSEIADGGPGENTQDLIAQGSLDFGDVDLSDGHTVDATPDGAGYRGTLTASVSDTSQGDGTGSIAWTFTVNDGDLDDLAAGETLVQTYTVTVIDPNGATDTQLVTITIVGVNDAPAFTGGPGIGSVTEIGDGDAGENVMVLTTDGTIAFGDVDLADGHTVSVSPAGAEYLGSLTASVSDASQGDGSGLIAWSFQVGDGELDYLSATDTLVQVYTIEVDDGNGGTDTETVTITIQGTNDDPVITAADTSGAVQELPDGAADENTLVLSANGTIVFDDVDANDTHTVDVSVIGSAPRGSLTAVVSGTSVLWTYTVSDGELDDLAEGDTVIQSYLITIDDGQGGTDSQIVDITLTGTNDVAIITGTSTGMVIEDDAIDTIGGLLDVVDPDIRQDGTVEAAFVAAVILGTYGTLTIDADGVWSYTLDNSLETTDGLVFGDQVTDSFTVSTIDGTTQIINIAVTGVGYDFEFSEFGGHSGSSAFKSIDAGTIDTVEIDLLITPMPLTVTSGGKEVANKVNATQTDLGVGVAQDIAFDEGLVFEFITEAESSNQDNLASLEYVSHISLVLFQAEISQVQGSQDATASILLRIVNADDDKNFDTMDDDGDIIIPLSASDVTVTVADGNDGNYEIIQVDDTVVITGLQEGDSFTINSSTTFNRVEVENISEIYGGSNFELGVLAFNMPEELMLEGDGTSAPLIGADSNDTLNSGPGQQELTGGAGIDVFVFDASASTGALADIIIDYEADIDVIDLTGLFDLAAGDFTEAAVEEYVRYLSGNDNDAGTDPSGSTGDLYIDADGDANGENFVLLAHSNTQTDSLILKVDDGTDIGYVTIV